jgi:hypothetical protein
LESGIARQRRKAGLLSSGQKDHDPFKRRNRQPSTWPKRLPLFVESYLSLKSYTITVFRVSLTAAKFTALQPNALGWLRLIAAHATEKKGKVMPSASTWNNRWRRWRQEEDTPLPLAWWVGKDDVLRHSYGTYRAAILRNSHNLAEEMGNSVAIVRTYYDAVVSPSVAKLWWRIAPERPENVVRVNSAT